MRVVITRGVSPAIGDCELTFLEREAIDVENAQAQHSLYEGLLEELGCRVERLDEEPGFPDSVFVEDIAVVLDDIAVITRPGALSRRGERASIERALAPHRPIRHIQAPGILDGGDALAVAKSIYVGLSTRSNAEAAAIFAFRFLNCSPAVVSCSSEGESDGSATELETACPI